MSESTYEDDNYVVFQELVEVDGEMVNPCIYFKDYPDLKKLVFKIVNEGYEEERRIVAIELVNRDGWDPDFNCPWAGDITRPDDEILAECRFRIANADSITDQERLQTDEEILAKIGAARQRWASRPARYAAATKARDKQLAKEIEYEDSPSRDCLLHEDFVALLKWLRRDEAMEE